MRVVRLLPLVIAALMALPAAAAAQAPPPDERAAAQAFADAAKRLLAASEALDETGDPGWLEDCRALRRDPPDRREAAARVFVDGLVIREVIGQLKPHVFRLRSELAQAQTADPALVSGRAAVRRLGRLIAAIPPAEADPCAAYAAYADAGYPRGPAREARALQRSLDVLLTRGMERRIGAAAVRIEALGVSRADALAFGQLAD
jgi:hypothetical protein